MKVCPNPDCPFARKFWRAGEYRDEATVCSDCGATLLDAPAASATSPAPEAAVVKGSGANARLAVTLAASSAVLALSRLPLFGAPESVRGAAPQAQLPLLAVGFGPFMWGFILVELVALVVPGLNRLRTGGPLARRGLDRTAWVLGGALFVVQVAGIAAYAQQEQGALPMGAVLWAQLLVAHLAMLGLAVAVTRFGLGGGFGMLLAVSALESLLQGLAQLSDVARSAEVAPAAGLLVLLVHGAALLLFLHLVRNGRSAGGAEPSAVPLPVSTLGPMAWAGAVLTVPMTVAVWLPGAEGLTRALNSSSALTTGLQTFLAFDAALVLGLLFFRPRAVSAMWKRWVPGVDETGVVLAARRLLPRALAASIALTVGAPLVLQVLGARFGLAGASTGVLLMLLLAAFGVDVARQWRALRRLGPLASVWEVQRTAEVEPVVSLLRTAGIEACPRGLLVRATQQFFGPFLPVAILVPVAREAEARRVIATRAGPTA